jgi:hypothetical protein
MFVKMNKYTVRASTEKKCSMPLSISLSAAQNKYIPSHEKFPCTSSCLATSQFSQIYDLLIFTAKGTEMQQSLIT